jgi:hypothetical protein
MEEDAAAERANLIGRGRMMSNGIAWRGAALR